MSDEARNAILRNLKQDLESAASNLQQAGFSLSAAQSRQFALSTGLPQLTINFQGRAYSLSKFSEYISDMSSAIKTTEQSLSES